MKSSEKENKNDSACSVYLYTAHWKYIDKALLQSCGLITHVHWCPCSFDTQELH